MGNQPKSEVLGRHQAAFFAPFGLLGILKHSVLASAYTAATKRPCDDSTVSRWVTGDVDENQRQPEIGLLGVVAHVVGAIPFLEACAIWLNADVEIVPRAKAPATGKSFRDELFEAQGAHGALAHLAMKLTADGHISSSDRDELKAAIRDAMKELAEADAALDDTWTERPLGPRVVPS